MSKQIELHLNNDTVKSDNEMSTVGKFFYGLYNTTAFVIGVPSFIIGFFFPPVWIITAIFWFIDGQLWYRSGGKLCSVGTETEKD